MDRLRRYYQDYKSYIGLASAAVAVTAMAANYFLNVVETPQVYHKSSADSVVSRVVQRLETLQQSYYPTFWCYTGYASTIVGAKIRIIPELTLKREEIALPDGGVLALDWFGDLDAHLGDNSPILIFLPGLTGDSSAPYIRHLLVSGCGKGYRCCVMNYRGSAGMPLKNAVIYSASWTSDIRHVSRLVAARFPMAPMVGIAFSLGSNIMTKCVCEDGDATAFSAIISISNPFDCEIVSEFMAANHLMDSELARGCVKLFERKRKELLSLLKEASIEIDVESLVKTKSMKDYDRLFTSKLFGFATVDDYYRTSSCIRYFHNLKIPAFFVSAKDDPICAADAIPYAVCLEHDHTALIVTSRGGHVGFLEGVWPSTLSWSDKVAMNIVEHVIPELVKVKKPFTL